jgi:hypothetical protein
MEAKTKSQPKTKVNAKTDESIKAFECQCGKQYKFETHLNKHKNICKAVSQTPIQEAKKPKEPKEEQEEAEEDQSDDDEPMDEKSLIMKLIKENQELKRVILHQHNKLLEQDEKFLECFKMFIAQILSAAAAEDQAMKNQISQSGEPTTKNT